MPQLSAPGCWFSSATGERLLTATVTAAAVLVLPAASRATALKLCEPLCAVLVSQATCHGALVTSAPRFAPSSLSCTPATPTLSVAFAVTVTVPETVAPAAGELIETDGAAVSFITVTVTAADVVLLPAASRAIAVIVCDPLAALSVFHCAEYGAAVSSAPALLPSTWNCTPTTPTLSEAFAASVIAPETVAPAEGDVIEPDGAVVSLKTVIVTVAEVVRLPAASRAIAVMVCEPFVALSVFHCAEYGAAVSSAPALLPSTWNCTPATPTLSEAFAASVTEPDTVAPGAGELTDTDGGVVSLKTVIVTAAEVVRLPAASRAIAVMVCEPFVALSVFHCAEYGAAVSSAPALLPSTRNCTPTTPTLSEAFAVSVIAPDTVAPADGEVIDTAGAVVSLKTVTVTELELHCAPRMSRATATSVCEPLLAVRVSQLIAYGALVSAAPRLAPSSLNCTLCTVSPPMIVTLARTGIVPVTLAPFDGAVIVTTRLPSPSWAAASRGASAATMMVAAQLRMYAT